MVEPNPLAALQHGLREVVTTVHQVHAVSSEAEEAHFTAEEAVTAVQAADEPGSDELLQALLAGQCRMNLLLDACAWSTCAPAHYPQLACTRHNGL